MATAPQPMNSTKRIIINVCVAIGIVGGIVARRFSGAEGILYGALFGAGGAVLGLAVGAGLAHLLVKERV